MRNKIKRLGLLSLAAIIITSAGVAYWRHQAAQLDNYVTTKVKHSDIQQTISALGVLVPSQYVDVGAQVSGQLIKMPVKLGDTVRQGQLIGEIDPTRYIAQVAQDRAQITDLKAQLAQARATLALAVWTYESNSGLAAQGAATRMAREQSAANLKVAQAAVASVQAQIDKANNVLKVNQANLDYTRIVAPISGLVISPTSANYGAVWSKLDIARQGQTLNSSQNAPLIMRIANLDRMVVRAQVSEADVAKLRIGMPVEFVTLGRPDRRLVAQLDAIEVTPELVNGAIFYDATFEVPNTDHSLLPQMTAQVFFVAAQANNTLVVPLTALASVQRQNGGRVPACPTARSAENDDCVQVLVDGSPKTWPVTVGVKNEINAQILKGLQAGDKVIISTAGAPAPGSGKSSGNGKGSGSGGNGNGSGQ